MSEHKYFMPTQDLLKGLKQVEPKVTELAGDSNLVNAAIEKIERLESQLKQVREALEAYQHLDKCFNSNQNSEACEIFNGESAVIRAGMNLKNSLLYGSLVTSKPPVRK